MTPDRQIRARHDVETIRVYQAYNASIADAALSAGRFVPSFKPGRMTWIKPSFCWMMYRSGFASKADQERILAIDVRRDGFDQALRDAVLSYFDPAVHASRDAWAARRDATAVRVQWDPERDVLLDRLPHRSLQLGLAGDVARRYVEDWTVAITDVTALATSLAALPPDARREAVAPTLAAERPYPMPPDAVEHLLPRQAVASPDAR